MTLDQIITAVVYLIAVFIIFYFGKFIFDKLHPKFKLKEELVEKDNLALALAVTGYYLGLIFVIGGTLIGPSSGLIADLSDIFFYGIIGIILLNLSNVLNDKIILYKFNNDKEIVDDQNSGTGIIIAANYFANGLILFGAISGEGGDIVTAVVFWICGQVALIIAAFLYNLITPFDVHEHIEKDNVAVGVAMAGLILALGNIISTAISGDFISWQENLSRFIGFVIVGLILLPVMRLISDKILLPGRKLTNELVNQEKPNIGAGILEAFSYVAASIVLGWVL
jgi:uncharacterized membrane protein YjfL (UPF0719 family)